MRISVSKEVLHKCLSHILGVVERKNTIPILANVKLSSSKDAEHNLILSATDMDISVQEMIPANITDTGELTVPAHTFHEIVRKLPDDSEILLEYSEATKNRLQISAKNCNFTLPVMSATEFPEIPITDITHKFFIEKSDLCKLIEKTKFAISNEEIRYYLNGIFIHIAEEDNKKFLRSVATDGHRLALSQVNKPDGAEDMPGIIIPRKTVSEIIKVLNEQEDGTQVEMQISKSKIKLSFNDVTLISKLIDANYPSYDRVIPKTNSIKLDIDVKQLAKAIDRVATISSEKSRAIKFVINENKLVIQANNVDTGFAQEELEVDYKAKLIESGFNSKYLLEVASVIEGENIRMMLAESGAPTLIYDASNDSSLYVIMPVRM